MSEFLWQPSGERKAGSNMTSFMRYVEQLTKKKIHDYSELYDWSVNNIEEFWKSIFIQSGLIHSKNYSRVLSGGSMFESKWFEGAELNFAENLLRFRDERTALISIREGTETVRLTYNQLYSLTAKCAAALKEAGVKKGDRVAGYVSNTPEAVIAMLAAASIGALWSSASPDFGLRGIVDRFGQIKPKVLFAVEEYMYHGKKIDCRGKLSDILKNISSIEKTVVIPRVNSLVPPEPSAEKQSGGAVYFNDFINNEAKEIEFVQLPFDHPVYIMYSSGTTGIPKCIVHGAGGTLLQHYKELALHTNLTRNDVIMYYTTCGWMMWNWLVSSLFIGASVVLYEGSPAYPDISILWKLAESEGITVFGTSPKYLTSCEKSPIYPKEKFNLSSLAAMLSTGSPLSEENFKWVYKNVKEDIQLSSISGGTDIISCFMLGSPVLPVYAGEIQCRGLGMKVEAFDENGSPVIDKKGELVCTKPFPSMPVYFWNDGDGRKYREAYFSYYENVWRHGDFIKITQRGTIVVYGRSDATLNPGGIRIGTAEIYRIVESMDEVADSLVIGQNYNNDVRIVLFVVLKGNMKLDSLLTEKIKSNIKSGATPRHVPAIVLQADDIPRTISGKKVELAVTAIFNGSEVTNRDALANPGSLDQYYQFKKNLEQ